jgi:hypothetical protein
MPTGRARRHAIQGFRDCKMGRDPGIRDPGIAIPSCISPISFEITHVSLTPAASRSYLRFLTTVLNFQQKWRHRVLLTPYSSRTQCKSHNSSLFDSRVKKLLPVSSSRLEFTMWADVGHDKRRWLLVRHDETFTYRARRRKWEFSYSGYLLYAIFVVQRRVSGYLWYICVWSCCPFSYKRGSKFYILIFGCTHSMAEDI